ncbi:MAG: hypothetical protein AAF456_06415 [Planctomycetota bacterium]
MTNQQENRNDNRSAVLNLLFYLAVALLVLLGVVYSYMIPSQPPNRFVDLVKESTPSLCAALFGYCLIYAFLRSRGISEDKDIDVEKLAEEIAKRLPARPTDNSQQFWTKSSDLQGAVIRDLISNTTSTALFAGVHFGIHASDCRSALKDAMARGVILDYVLIDPTDFALLSRIADSFGMPGTELQNECDIAYQKLLQLKNEVAGLENRLRISFTNDWPTGRYYVFDEHVDSGLVVMVHFLPGTRSSHSPAATFSIASEIGKNVAEECRELQRSLTAQ